MNFWRKRWKKSEVFCSVINTNHMSWKKKAQWENPWNEMQLQYNGQEKELRVIAEKSLKALIRMRHCTSEEVLWITLAVAAEYKNSIIFLKLGFHQNTVVLLIRRWYFFLNYLQSKIIPLKLAARFVGPCTSRSAGVWYGVSPGHPTTASQRPAAAHRAPLQPAPGSKTCWKHHNALGVSLKMPFPEKNSPNMWASKCVFNPGVSVVDGIWLCSLPFQWNPTPCTHCALCQDQAQCWATSLGCLGRVLNCVTPQPQNTYSFREDSWKWQINLNKSKLSSELLKSKIKLQI